MATRKPKPDYKAIAHTIFVFGLPRFNMDFYKVQLRDGKTVQDIEDAKLKALRNGMKKIEFEIDFFALYLKDILKAV